jgi:hypothetical protein
MRLVEVEGESGRQREQALYSSLAPLLLSMKFWNDQVTYGLGVPDTRGWWDQLQKVPLGITNPTTARRYSVWSNPCTSIEPGIGPDWERG